MSLEINHDFHLKKAPDLRGIHLVSNQEEILPQFIDTDSEDRIRAFLEVQEKVARFARACGATVIRADSPFSPDGTDSTYRLDPPRWRNPDVRLRQLEKMLQPYAHEIPELASARLSSYTITNSTYALHEQLEAGSPFVVAYTRFERGHCKYLIESSEQLEKFLAVVKKIENAYPAYHNIANFIEVRPFVESPSDLYTTWRYIVAAGSGALLAMGIHYSGHTCDDDRVIVNDRPFDTWDEVTLLKQALESPESEYFLASRDIRSNVSSGGGVIPRMGTNRAPSTPIEDAIVAAHQSKRACVNKRKNMEATAAFIGRICGSRLDICLGIDTIQDRQTEEEFLLEINPGPGARLFNACHLGGLATNLDALYLQRCAALQCLAEYREGRHIKDYAITD